MSTVRHFGSMPKKRKIQSIKAPVDSDSLSIDVENSQDNLHTSESGQDTDSDKNNGSVI